MSGEATCLVIEGETIRGAGFLLFARSTAEGVVMATEGGGGSLRGDIARSAAGSGGAMCACE